MFWNLIRSAVLFLGISTPLIAQDALEAFIEVTGDRHSKVGGSGSLGYHLYPYVDPIPFVTHSPVHAAWSTNGFLKILLHDHRDVEAVATAMKYSGGLFGLLKVQVHFDGAVFDGDEFIKRANYGFFYKNGVFTCNNQETVELLESNLVLNLFGLNPPTIDLLNVLRQPKVRVAPMEQLVSTEVLSTDCGCGGTSLALPMEDPGLPTVALMVEEQVGIEEPIDGTSCCPEAEVNCPNCNDPNKNPCPDPPGKAIYNFPSGSNCNPNDPDIRDQLMQYKYFTLKQLGNGECFCFGTDPVKTPCKQAWRDLLNEYLPAPDGQQNGHVPDSCAGGQPGPFGIWLPINSSCNASMGTQCNQQGNPGTCYNDIEFRSGGVAIVFPEPTQAQKDEWEEKMRLRSNSFCEMMKGKTDGPCESWPAKVRQYVCRCLKGIVPKCSIKPKPVQQVVPPVE